MDTLLRRRMMLAGGDEPIPLPYTPVDYIETDGDAYINTGIIGTGGKSAELKILAASLSSGNQVFLGVTSGEDNKSTMFVPCLISSNGKCYFGYYFFYASDAPSVATSIANCTPFEVRVSLKKSAQSLGVRRDGESTFTSYSKTQSSNVSNTVPMFLFAGRNPSGGVARKCVAGSRVYYARIYSDANYATLAFDGVPCLYNGEYGLWDKISDSFFGNANSTGAFSGPI